jgi:outer membrane protein
MGYRSLIATFTAAALTASAQQPAGPPRLGNGSAIAPIRPTGSIFKRPYVPVDTPAIRMTNSQRLADLVRAGQLHLTLQDAILLALENNIDIEIARYGPVVSEWRLQRAEAGGALPGVPSAASQAGQVAAGQGVTGSQNSAGVAGGGGQGNQQGGNNASISQIGPVTQNLDPAFQETTTFSHVSTPQANVTQSATNLLISDTRSHTGSLQQGFLSGGAVTIRFSQNYLKENSPTNILNPTVAPNLQFSFQHALGSGFGKRVNARNITIAKINRGVADLTFQNRVIDIVSQVQDLYYSLAAAHEDLKAKSVALETAQSLLANVKRQVDLGSAAPPDVISAETETVNSQLAVVNARTTLEQQEVRLKNMLSRNGLADRNLATAQLVPIDGIAMPAQEQLPTHAELLKEALEKRIDLRNEKTGLQTSAESSLGTRSGLLPNVQAFGGISQAGLAGEAKTGPGLAVPDPKFVGGTGTALGQVFSFDFQTRRIGVFAQVPMKNRQAQADFAVDQLSLRQSELNYHKHANQLQVDISSALTSLQQARARHEYAVRNRKLQEELVRAEQKKFEFGASKPYDVIQQRRDLASAQSAEMTALSTYVRARASLDRTIGRTLETNRITIGN